MLEEHNNNLLDDEENKLSTMGASRNMPNSRVILLQERKKQIEDTLAKRNQELRQLCIQEAELTGITPPEMPLEPGETLPHIRRRVGTSYQLPEKLIKNVSNKDEMISELELEIQLHANMAEAALGLANEQNMSKTMKRQHRSEYQKHKQQCLALQEKLAALKEKAAVDQQKQKKKPRVPESNGDDTVSLSTNGNESFIKADLRHSMSSAKHSTSGDGKVELRYRQDASRQYRMTDIPYVAQQASKPEDILTSGFYRLSLNGYSKYMERRENMNNVYPSYISGSPQFQYNSQTPINNLQHNISYRQHSPISQHSPLLSQHSPHLSQHSPHYIHISQHKPQLSPQQSQRFSQYPQYSTDFVDFGNRQSSPTASLSTKTHYYPSHPTLTRQNYRQYESDVMYRNPHQIQPHQQYEQMNIGLGGYWKRNPNGDLVWYSSSVIDSNLQRDKRFGSLDRRKTKRVSSRISPNMENKSATLSAVPNYQGQVRCASVKNSQILTRRSQDNGQLVRTQSLGSVGAITVDSVYPTDDSSSFGSDSRNMEANQISKKHREKEWLETSLDGPVALQASASPLGPAISPQPSLSSSQPTIATYPAEEKIAKEIPAESNPSPKIREPIIELFNNNIPKNCTIVQAGHCKPYHEETKPFEMSDFYKYSTKFKKSPVKVDSDKQNSSSSGTSHKNLTEKFEESPITSYSPNNYQNISNNGSTPVNLDNTLSTSLDLDQLTVSDHFSDEMNTWYKEHRKNNNNPGNTTPKSRSTATLV
ncbi:uncharacterized protein LOC130893369 [Diorhabda carinulata]|uniref:uncharacterized protein LOC130893369 n=1 Tax=Diorhabda carinulata TaxID=1163345 RepID=UPI0025A16309|nr:uncharacterized protein LOC130893369 [Diorhabda carinulata]